MTDDTQAEDAPKDEEAPEATNATEESSPVEEAPGAEATSAGEPEPDAPAEAPTAEEPEPDAPAEAPTAEEAAAEEVPTAEEPAEAPAEEDAPTPEEPEAEAPKPRPKRARKKDKAEEPEVIPGAHLEPDLVLEEKATDRESVGGSVGAEIEAAELALKEEDGEPVTEPEPEEAAPAPVPATVLNLAADARYVATGKRKRAVARVILKPGTGIYTVNGREMNAFFPRPTLQTIVRAPLQTVGHEERMDVVAKIHGGGVSSQAGALRHGISKALTEADPNLRGELKSRGFLTRDPRVKERKKAGLKKARKRPQFSKR